MKRREFLYLAGGAPAVMHGAPLSATARVDRALQGESVDRPPFTLWHHFQLKTAEAHAQRTLEFHTAYRTDIVKVMSDFDYPKSTGKWWELKIDRSPFPQQIRALELIRDGLAGKAYFLETLFNPMNVAEKLSSKEELKRLRLESPQTLLDALEVITQSEINHARRALETGAAGVFLSVANAKADELSLDEYRKFSAPFDRRILEAVKGARMNVLHLHVEPAYLEEFKGWPASVINYSLHVSGIAFAEMRKRFPQQVLMGGLDEVNYRTLAPAALKQQWQAAAKTAGRKFILTPGCSVPNESTDAELKKMTALIGA